MKVRPISELFVNPPTQPKLKEKTEAIHHSKMNKVNYAHPFLNSGEKFLALCRMEVCFQLINFFAYILLSLAHFLNILLICSENVSFGSSKQIGNQSYRNNILNHVVLPTLKNTTKIITKIKIILLIYAVYQQAKLLTTAPKDDNISY